MKGHSVRYLAAKARQAESLSLKRKERDTNLAQKETQAKKARHAEQQDTGRALEALKRKAFTVLEKQMAGYVAQELSREEMALLVEVQEQSVELRRRVEEHVTARALGGSAVLGGGSGVVFGDDGDARMT